MAHNNYQSSPDSLLVFDFLHEHNQDAFGELYKRYYGKVVNYCLAIAHSQDIAEDLAQDILLKALDNLPRLHDPELFNHWLFRIAHNRCLDWIKNKQKWHIVGLENAGIKEAEAAPETEDKWTEEKRICAQLELLENLPSEIKTILMAKYKENKTIVELQQTYGLSESAVKMRLARARQKVTSLYEMQRIVA
ncbi:MAG TPA: sigma-70 family RNA polymerase sigma factor [Saprospiraceae bacterium]|nr:sigma-70 family RNA polymerase sigma factor [Saprospiraceae bacterium]